MAFGGVTLAAAPALATTAASWTVSNYHLVVYYDGGFASTYFSKPPTTLPATATITNTSWIVTPYTNGNTADAVKICYQEVYTATDYRCLDIFVTNGTTVSTTVFNGLSPRGTFVITHTVTGGTYPSPYSSAQDTVTVDYQY